MPSYASHLLQSLDVDVFGPLKHAYGKLVEGMMIAGNNHIDKENFLYLYPSAREAVFTQKDICNGFMRAGLKPLNKDQVFTEITFHLRTPTPSLVDIEGSISSAFQTSQTTRQLDHKARSLQKSLQKERTLSSSPVSHIQYLEKAGQMAMNMNLLLQQEIKVLRAENEWKKKEKARKRALIGEDLFISVQESRERVEQLEEVVEEVIEPRLLQQAPSRCSGCGTLGHTIRSCPNK